jgi:hypothetical protein
MLGIACLPGCSGALALSVVCVHLGFLLSHSVAEDRLGLCFDRYKGKAGISHVGG